MTTQNLFIKANQALKSVVDQIKDDQWGIQVPAGITRHPANLRQTVNYHAYDDAWVPDVLSGKTSAEVGDKYDGDLLGNDPKGSYATLNDQANAAVRQFTELTKLVHLSYGDFPAEEYLWHISTFRGLRAHDLAQLIGADARLPADLVQGLWDIINPHADEWRKMGVFGPAIEVPADAPLQDRLLGLTGREPS